MHDTNTCVDECPYVHTHRKETYCNAIDDNEITINTNINTTIRYKLKRFYLNE